MKESCFVLDQHTEPDFFNVLDHESKSLQEDMPFNPVDVYCQPYLPGRQYTIQTGDNGFVPDQFVFIVALNDHPIFSSENEMIS